MKQFNDSAVSPVVGVMLMLVVTIIIAAVVSGFAGGLGSDQSKTPQATLSCTPVIEGIKDTNLTDWAPDYPTGFEANNGIMFEHKGGDSFALEDIAIQLQTSSTKAKISLADELLNVGCYKDDVTEYIQEIGSTDGLISPGDKFMLYADNCRIDDVPEWGFDMAKQISWKPMDAAGGFALYLDTTCEYKIIYKETNAVIQQGTFVLR